VAPGAWVKLKLDRREFVVGDNRPGDLGVDALLLGDYERKALRVAAKVRAGLTRHLRRTLFDGLQSLHTRLVPLQRPPQHRA
jgi:ATP-dependent DNA ligase